jgi:PAS domain S-box-containing protein
MEAKTVETQQQLTGPVMRGYQPGWRSRIFLVGCAEADEAHVRGILTEACHEPFVETIRDKASLEARLDAAAPDLLMTAEEGSAIHSAHVLEIARTRAPRTPVIVFSNVATEDAALRAIERGAADFIQLDRRWKVSFAVRRALREHEQQQRRKEAEDRLRNHINLLQLQQVVATAANEALSPEDAAQSLMDITRAYGHFTLAHLFFTADNDPSRLRASAIWSGYDHRRHAALRERTDNLDFSTNSGVATEVLREGELAWIADISSEPRLIRAEAALEAGLRSVVMAPVAAGSETLGVIEFFGEAVKPRDEHMALVLEYVATQLGRVFERDRAERRLEKRAQEQMVLAELSRKAVDVVSLDEFLKLAARRVEDVLLDCRCAVLEATPDATALRLRTSTEQASGPRVEDRLIPAASEKDIGHAVLHGDLLKLDFTAPLPWKVPSFLPKEVARVITASIRLRNDVFGALVAYSLKTRDFSRSECTFLRSVANILATAAEHSTAFHQLQLLGSAVTQSHDSIMITDADLNAPGPRILFVNPAFTQITGYRIDEVLGFSPRILQGEKTDADFVRRVHTRLREGKAAHGETINYRKDGSEIWIEMQISPLRNPAGKITHFVGIQRDITERKIAEERLRDSEAMLGAAQRLAHLGSWVLEFRSPRPGKGRLVWSDEVFRIFGYAPGGIEVTNEAFFQSVHPEDRARVEEVFQRALRERTEYQIDHRIIRPDGVQRIVHEQGTTLYDETGDPLKVLGTVQDITESKQAEEEVRHWKERYEILTKASGQIIYDWDCMTGRRTYGGDTERMIGCTPESLGSTIEEWIARVHPEDQGGFERGLDQLASGKNTREIEYRLRREDDTYITVKSIRYPMRDENGAVVRIIGSITDISAERTLEVQLRRSQKMEAFGKLAGGVAHDFNNLLTVITGYNEVVMSELAADDPKREYIEEIARAANRASALTSQLLAFSRQQKLQPRVVNLNTVLRETSKMLARLIGEDIEMRLDVADDLGNAKADVGQIEQVLMNLAVNARDAMPGGGMITMSTRNSIVDAENATANLQPGEYILLEVTDTGTGMSPDVQARIFEPFFTTKAPGQGTGLGLATCYGIVKQSGGEIAVISKLGSGTTFQIYLPRVHEDLKSYDIPLGPGDLPTGYQTILLVEDELPVRAIIRSILQRLKYTVVEAANGAEAMRILLTPGDKPVDVLITDLIMPEMGGRELARRTRSAFPDIAIIFTSGYPVGTQEELLPGAIFLQKPFSPKALAEAVKDALRT